MDVRRWVAIRRTPRGFARTKEDGEDDKDDNDEENDQDDDGKDNRVDHGDIETNGRKRGPEGRRSSVELRERCARWKR